MMLKLIYILTLKTKNMNSFYGILLKLLVSFKNVTVIVHMVLNHKLHGVIIIGSIFFQQAA